jgi:hypothetical protein
MSAPLLSRRDWLCLSTAGVLGSSLCGWFESLADAAAVAPARKKSCILLWMNGGPSTIDLWDLKPGHANGGSFKEIATSAPGVRISEHLPKLAKWCHKMALVRSLTSKEGDHGRAAHLMHTGYLPSNSVPYPTLGSLVCRELTRADFSLPPFVSIAPYRFFNQAAYSSGFLGPMHAPLIIGDGGAFARGQGTRYEEMLKVKDLEPAGKVSATEIDSRLDLLGDLNRDFATDRPDTPPRSHHSAVTRAVRLMKSAARKAFDLDQEKSSTRDAYGRNLFGQGCLLARRLVEQGVPFIEVSLGGLDGNGFAWDTHQNNFEQVKALSTVLDTAWAALMKDLHERGLLGSTLIVWMGEFGRTPQINNGAGRDHWPNSYAAVLAGGGIKGGQAYGKTSKDGTTVEAGKVTVPDFLATVVKALGIDPEKQNLMGARPIRIVEKGAQPITEILG